MRILNTQHVEAYRYEATHGTHFFYMYMYAYYCISDPKILEGGGGTLGAGLGGGGVTLGGGLGPPPPPPPSVCNLAAQTRGFKGH